MTRTCLLVPAILLGVFLTGSASVFSQAGKPTEQSHYSGQRLWVVVKGDLNDFTNKGDIVQADFDTEREAQADAKRRNDSLTGSDSYKYLFTYRKRTTGDPTVASYAWIPGKGITLPKTKFIDPGPLKLSSKKTQSLAGNKGQGRIGNSKVTMDFRANNELVITGEMESRGTWSQTDSGGITMETAASKFRGNINGEQLAGVRFSKDNSQQLTEWNVTLVSVADYADYAERLSKWLEKADLAIEQERANNEAKKKSLDRQYEAIPDHTDFRCPNGESWGKCTHYSLKIAFLDRNAAARAANARQQDTLDRRIRNNNLRIDQWNAALRKRNLLRSTLEKSESR